MIYPATQSHTFFEKYDTLLSTQEDAVLRFHTENHLRSTYALPMILVEEVHCETCLALKVVHYQRTEFYSTVQRYPVTTLPNVLTI